MGGEVMCSQSATLTKTRDRLEPKADWGDSLPSYTLIAHEAPVVQKPITVTGSTLEFESSLLEVGRVYPFEYLGSDMVLWKIANGSVELYEVVDE
jgi:hypothetical protein